MGKDSSKYKRSPTKDAFQHFFEVFLISGEFDGIIYQRNFAEKMEHGFCVSTFLVKQQLLGNCKRLMKPVQGLRQRGY